MKVLPRQVLAKRLVASLGSEPATAGPSVDSKRAGCVLGHVIGSSRSAEAASKVEATPGSALKASRFWAAGVGDHITRAQKSWESSRTPVDARQCEPAVPPLRLGTQRRPVFPPGRASPLLSSRDSLTGNDRPARSDAPIWRRAGISNDS